MNILQVLLSEMELAEASGELSEWVLCKMLQVSAYDSNKLLQRWDKHVEGLALQMWQETGWNKKHSSSRLSDDEHL